MTMSTFDAEDFEESIAYITGMHTGLCLCICHLYALLETMTRPETKDAFNELERSLIRLVVINPLESMRLSGMARVVNDVIAEFSEEQVRTFIPALTEALNGERQMLTEAMTGAMKQYNEVFESQRPKEK